MARSVLTGGPGAGKSTLLDALAKAGFRTVPEAARTILQQEGGRELRRIDPVRFAMEMLKADLAAFEAATSHAHAFLDRGFPDIVGFLRLEGLAIPAELDRICRTRRYEGPIFRAAPWREIYRRDEERVQSWVEAVESDRAVMRAWRDYGYEEIDLPEADILGRVNFVRARL